MDFLEYLATLTAKHPSGITEQERAFMTARASYLTPQQIADYGISVDGTPEVVTVEAKEKKGKKTEAAE
ncbi:MAG: hypothetical protein U0892_15605 [Pirellulales bacterium]